MKLQNKLKWIQRVKLFLAIISVLAVVKILNDYNEINNSFSQQQQNYEMLKLLHEQTLSAYNIDISNNKQLAPISDIISYQETMIKGLSPNSELVSYYFYILILGSWIMMFTIGYLNKKENELQGFPVDLDDE